MYVLVCVVAALLTLYVYYRRGGPKKGRAIPGPTGLPVVGYAYKIERETVHQLYYDLAKQYGDIFQINALGKDIIVINNAEMVRSLFCDDPYKRYTNDRIKTFYGTWVLFGNQSIFSAHEAFNSAHADLRKAFTRGMHVYGEGIRSFEEKVHSELVNLNERLDGLNGQEFDMQKLITRSLSNVVAIFLSGQPMADDDPDVNMFWEFDRAMDYLFRPDVDLILGTFPALRLVPGVYKRAFDDINKAKQAILQHHFHKAKESFEPGTIRGLVDFYLTEQHNAQQEGRHVLFTDDRICALMLETIAGGVLTTLSNLMSLFLCLLNHPEYQTKIQEEVDRVVGLDSPPSVSDKQDCVFIEAVNCEVQRLITVLPLSVPHLCQTNIEFQGYDIPANAIIFANTWFIHHDKKIWGDPWTFRPERWIDNNGQLLPNDHVLRKNWLPFGTGRRQCIGESLARSRSFLYVASMLQRWNFEASPSNAVSCDPRDGNMDVDISCRPKPYRCRAVPRKIH